MKAEAAISNQKFQIASLHPFLKLGCKYSVARQLNPTHTGMIVKDQAPLIAQHEARNSSSSNSLHPEKQSSTEAPAAVS